MIPALSLEIDVLQSQFQVHETALRLLMRDPILHDLSRRAIRVESAAKRIASNASPSSPGQGPGVITGRLRASITWRPGSDDISPFVDVGTAVHYAPFLELGTRKMAARPFLRPALEFARA